MVKDLNFKQNDFRGVRARKSQAARKRFTPERSCQTEIIQRRGEEEMQFEEPITRTRETS